MSERDASDPTNPAPTTPRASGEASAPGFVGDTPVPESVTRVAEPDSVSAPPVPSDTLLSVGPPANKLEVMLEDRLGTLDQRLFQLEDRLRVLEQKKPPEVVEKARTKPWLWVAFLVAIATVFQLLRFAQ